MAENDSPLRARQDALWRLVQATSAKVLNVLKARYGVSGRNKEKYQLLAWYAGQSSWSREMEKSKYPDLEQFRRLKYRTFRWLVEELADLKQYPHSAVYDLIAQVRTQIYHGQFPDVLDSIDAAKQAARERELFHELEQILELETIAIGKSLLGQEALERLDKARAESEDLDVILNDLKRWREVERKYRLALIAKSQRDGRGDSALEAEYRAYMESTEVVSCRSKRSEALFHFHWLFLLSRSREYEALLKSWKSYEALEGKGWVLEEDPDQYALLLLRLIGIASDKRDTQVSVELMARVMDLEGNDERTTMLAIDKVIFANFFFWWNIGDGIAAERACKLFDEHQGMLRNRLKSVAYIWLLFYKTIFRFKQGKYGECEKVIEEVFALDTGVKIDLMSHLRTLKVACKFLRAEDHAGFGVTTKAALRFLGDLEGVDTIVQIEVIEALELCAIELANGRIPEEIWKNTRVKLSLHKASEEHKFAFDTFDYLEFWIAAKQALMGPSQI